MNASDAVDTTSFNTSLHWANGNPPTAGNGYANAGFLLRTPTGAASYTFEGDSLVISGIAGDADPLNRALIYKGTGTAGIITINNLTVQDGGYISTGSGEGDLFHIAGNLLTIGTGGANFRAQNPIRIDSPVAGSGTVTITAAGASNHPVRSVTFSSGSNTFTGNINLPGGNQSYFVLDTTGNLNFNIGAAGVNNTITGTAGAGITLNGVINFNLTGAATTPGSTWTIVGAGPTATYGVGFTINGFTTDLGTGPGIWTSNSGTYQYNTGTGVLSVVPEPASYVMLLTGVLFVGVTLRRRRRTTLV